jgi:gluconolactonase
MLVCQHGNRRIVRLERDGSATPLAERFDGARLNSPNDLVVDSNGAVYFTDPPFGLPQVFEDPRKELSFSGVYRLDENGVRLVASELTGPNGIAFSPDERFLYVANWDVQRKIVMRYGVRSDGTLDRGTAFADLGAAQGDEALDGLEVDERGNVYVCGPEGVWVFDQGGSSLGVMVFPELPANLEWGGADGRTLFATARTSVYRVAMAVRGAIAPAQRASCRP